MDEGRMASSVIEVYDSWMAAQSRLSECMACASD